MTDRTYRTYLTNTATLALFVVSYIDPAAPDVRQRLALYFPADFDTEDAEGLARAAVNAADGCERCNDFQAVFVKHIHINQEDPNASSQAEELSEADPAPGQAGPVQEA